MATAQTVPGRAADTAAAAATTRLAPLGSFRAAIGLSPLAGWGCQFGHGVDPIRKGLIGIRGRSTVVAQAPAASLPAHRPPPGGAASPGAGQCRGSPRPGPRPRRAPATRPALSRRAGGRPGHRPARRHRHGAAHAVGRVAGAMDRPRRRTPRYPHAHGGGPQRRTGGAARLAAGRGRAVRSAAGRGAPAPAAAAGATARRTRRRRPRLQDHPGGLR